MSCINCEYVKWGGFYGNLQFCWHPDFPNGKPMCEDIICPKKKFGIHLELEEEEI